MNDTSGRPASPPATAGIPAGETATPAPFRPLLALRWLLVLPAGIVGWQLGVAGGHVGLGAVQGLCPSDAMVSGACTAPWSDTARSISVHLGVAIAAALAVLLPTLVAPSFRGTVAWSAYGFGAAAAGNAAWMADAWTEMLVAVVAGFVVLWFALRRWRSDGRARPRPATRPPA